MKKLIFISVAKHHSQYFNQILRNTGMSGKVFEWKNIAQHWRPFSFSGLTSPTYKELASEKILGRKQKGKRASALYELGLHLELRLIATSLARLFREHHGDLVVGVWNGSHRYHKIVKKISELYGGQILYFENGILPNTTTLDPKGVNYDNSVPRDSSFFLQYTPQNPSSLKEKLIPRKARSDKGGAIDLPESFFFVPFQDDRDTQVRNHSPWISDMRDLFDKLAKINRGENTFIFKEHPSSPIAYPDLHKRETESVLFANGNETQNLIEKSKAVITLNSTVGLEAILLNKPVIVLANAFYNIPGLALSASNTQELSAALLKIDDWTPNNKLRENFISYLKETYCIPGSWRTPNTEHWNFIRERISRHLD
ncbi:hypothetical protein [Alcanivorax sp.]|jgi:capsular polysaccharide export protein|uniref:capsular polysaccharide export protein, LipB/KpsS family n=1 Tax=Alcanivorax sp. TaxID=1872427 RepID=UPI0032D9AA6A